jgi:hypothetical protein
VTPAAVDQPTATEPTNLGRESNVGDRDAAAKADRLNRVTGTGFTPAKKRAQPGDAVLQLRITLADVADPPVWRRVLIPSAYPLDRVHNVVQAAMGWQNAHLHAFRLGDETYAAPDPDDEMGSLDETRFRLGDLVAGVDRIDYEYDFGDGWEHALVVEARAVAQDGAVYPACIAGEGACPPEDCGGSPGFAEFKAVLAGPPSAERDELLAWAGGAYDPRRFDVSAANAAVSAI